MATEQISKEIIPDRFIVSRRTLRLDNFMTYFVKGGGVFVIICVFGIFAFILKEAIFLFQKPKTDKILSVKVDPTTVLIGQGESGENFFTYDGQRVLQFFQQDQKIMRQRLAHADTATVTAHTYNPLQRQLITATSEGKIYFYEITFPEKVSEDKVLEPTHEAQAAAPEEVITQVSYGHGAESQVLAYITKNANAVEALRAITFTQKRTLLGGSKVEASEPMTLTDQLAGAPLKVVALEPGESCVVSTTAGTVDYFKRKDEAFERVQSFTPFPEGGEKAQLSLLAPVFGDVSLIIGDRAGQLRHYSLSIAAGDNERLFHYVQNLPSLPSEPSAFFRSLRHKSFFVQAGQELFLYHSTTGRLRYRLSLPTKLRSGAFDLKNEHLLLHTESAELLTYHFHDPHPEAGWRTFFGKIQYEGATAPAYTWQSTSGNDDFEPKLSLVPLIFGTLKGTFWALLFATPLALLAAIYTAHFVPPRIKRIVKPTMEIMASLPSVILGFIAALWLAPLIEYRVPSLLLCFVGIPCLSMLVGWLWSCQPPQRRQRLKPGYEWLALAPLILLGAVALWHAGPVVEKWLFGGSFRQWWTQTTGSSYDQRNSLVVGFIMGFAVIPIIFTICEDALSSVPPSLLAASDAMGASRWQTLRRVVLPVAYAGIFSAIMIGFGRAVGETMVVVMATGNTPIMEWNIFNGMRTLSANIAVELPEAAQGSTHYRTLFLSGLVLFIMTFFLNTIAELLRQHLRKKHQLF